MSQIVSAGSSKGIEIHLSWFVPALTNVLIPSTIKIIEEDAFCDCYSLISVIMPDGLKEVGARAFRGCKSLASTVIPSTVDEIGDEAFGACDKSFKKCI